MALPVWSARVLYIFGNSNSQFERGLKGQKIPTDLCFALMFCLKRRRRSFNYSYIAHTPGETSIMLRIKLLNI